MDTPLQTTVSDVMRGNAAADWVHNKYKRKPSVGNEYVVISLNIICGDIDYDELNLPTGDFILYTGKTKHEMIIRSIDRVSGLEPSIALSFTYEIPEGELITLSYNEQKVYIPLGITDIRR